MSFSTKKVINSCILTYRLCYWFVHQYFLMTVSRKIIVFKQSFQTINNFFFWWVGHYCPVHCDLFRSTVLSQNLGIRTWMCLLNFAQRPISSGLRYFMSLKSQTLDLQLKVPPGGIVSRSFTSWKNPSTSVGFEPANFGSRGEHVTPRPPRTTLHLVSIHYLTFFWILYNHFIVCTVQGD